MARLKYLLLAQILLVSCVAFAGDGTASCELADKNIVARTASGLAQVSNVGDIQITCSVPARPFPTKPGEFLTGLTVATKGYQVSQDGSEQLVPSEVNVTGGTKGMVLVPPGQEGVLFYLHVPLAPPEQKAEAESGFIAIALVDPEKGERKAHACAIAWFQQLGKAPCGKESRPTQLSLL